MNSHTDLLNSELSTRSKGLSDANRKVLQYIDSTFQKILNGLRTQPNERVEIKLKRITELNTVSQHDDPDYKILPERLRVKTREMKYSWPGSTADDAWRFTCLACILTEIRLAVLKGITITKRDIYYRHPEVFKRQETVDRFINDIAYTCGVTRRDLRVAASPKGLWCGPSYMTDVQSVPAADDLRAICPSEFSSIRWILVIEKEASFKTLVETNFYVRCSIGPGLLVTGKGYPDLSTRHFLRYVIDNTSHEISVFGLMDGDPDGIDIFRCYTYGSKQLVQEAACNLPEMQWLGVNVLELLSNLNVMHQSLPMTARDRTRATGMLARTGVMASDGGLDMELRSVLQTMLILGKKLEIQSLDVLGGGGICGWLNRKMRNLL